MAPAMHPPQPSETLDAQIQRVEEKIKAVERKAREAQSPPIPYAKSRATEPTASPVSKA